MIHGSVKLFLPLLFAIVLFSVQNLFAEPIFDDYESELVKKCGDLSAGKKNDEPKNPVSKFLLHSKEKIRQSITDLRERVDKKKAFPSNDYQKKNDAPSFSLEYQHKNTEKNQSTNSNQKSEKTTHRPNFLNRICGDSLKKLGIGTPVYCTLAGIVTHSGIAIGDKIVHLDGDGTIVFTSPQEFIDRLDGNNPAVNIYYAAYTGNTPLEIDFAAVHAMSQIGKKIKYDVLNKNCHGFTIWCITGNFNASVLSIKKVEEEIEKKCGKKWKWRCWDGWR